MVAHLNVFARTKRLVLPGDPDFELPPDGRWEGRLSPEWWSRPLWHALFGEFPIGDRSRIWLFGPHNTLSPHYEPWQVPPNAGTGAFWAINGGGGGGAGIGAAAGNTRQGGGGGASGPFGRVFVPLALVPRVLYARVGPGGTAGIVGVSSGFAGNGGQSAWCVYPSASNAAANQDSLIQGGSISAGGNGGAVAAGASGGGGGGAAGGAGFWAAHGYGATGLAGIAGGNGGSGNGAVPGAGTALFVTSPFHSGCGGGFVSNLNVASVGGGYTASTAYGFPSSGGAATGANGANGFSTAPWSAWNTDAWYCTGGTGGGGNAGGTGGQGGSAAWGCGGGGGGAGTTGGNGGRGGDGLCVVIVW
jgi:hypothetical protein